MFFNNGLVANVLLTNAKIENELIKLGYVVNTILPNS